MGGLGLGLLEVCGEAGWAVAQGGGLASGGRPGGGWRGEGAGWRWWGGGVGGGAVSGGMVFQRVVQGFWLVGRCV